MRSCCLFPYPDHAGDRDGDEDDERGEEVAYLPLGLRVAAGAGGYRGAVRARPVRVGVAPGSSAFIRDQRFVRGRDHWGCAEQEHCESGENG